jgi:hypothetical protein
MAKKKAPKKPAKKTVAARKRPSRPAARKASVKVVRKPLKKKKVTKPAARAAVKPAARRAAKKPARPAARKAAPKAVRKAVAKPAARKASPKPMAKKAPARKPVAAKPAKPAKAPAKAAKVATPPPATRLQRERKRLPEAEAEGFEGAGTDSRLLQSAKSGHDELQSELKQHTEASPEMTAGDIDAKWQDAYALGDEAPGGDNMTPDQDRVDDIGKALGIEYDDDEELQGGAELTARDESRWELDPDSKEDDEE